MLQCQHPERGSEMMRLVSVTVLIIALLAGTAACTANQRAKHFGGTMTVNLPPGQKLVVATWKEASLWYLTRPIRSGETPETYTFQENSEFGVIEGTVVFNEQPTK